MNQADISNLVSKLKFVVHPRRKFSNPEGPYGRIKKLRATVTALIKHERLEVNYARADEARGYAERLISEAIRHGDCHRPTMKMADFWLEEKQLVHKLFKVLVPRYQAYNVSYTRIYKAPRVYPGSALDKAILELKGNLYPSLMPDRSRNRYLIHNVLLDAAKADYHAEKYAKIAESMKKSHAESAVQREGELITKDSEGTATVSASGGISKSQGPTTAGASEGTSERQEPTTASAPEGTSERQEPTTASASVGTSERQEPTIVSAPEGTSEIQEPTTASAPEGTSERQEPTTESAPEGTSESGEPAVAGASVGTSEDLAPSKVIDPEKTVQEPSSSSSSPENKA